MKAYTLGRTSSYDKALTSGLGCTKLGSRPQGAHDIPEGYGGGWLWITPKEAENFRTSDLNKEWFSDPHSFSVYELDITSWEECASKEPDPSDGVHRLLVDSRIVKKHVFGSDL